MYTNLTVSRIRCKWGDVSSVFIANRGEIALRIVRTCRDLGLRSVVGWSDADVATPAVKLADATIRIGGAAPRESYLNISALVNAARRTNATLVHPGCGFVSENADFATAVAEAGLTFVGPAPEVLRDLGDKRRARELAVAAGLPVVPGMLIDESVPPTHDALRNLGFPLLVKAAHGGGGRGIRIARGYDELGLAIEQSRRESLAAFGKSDVFIERFVERARHVEVQVFGDTQGTIIDLGTRDCTVQRRHQKLIEEAPAPFLSIDVTEQIRESARRIASYVDYVNAGTAEFLVDPISGSFYFLEMNTRLQVEHPVTEMITGFDLVAMQLRVALGLPLEIKQRDVKFRGHALEVRVNAEDPHNGFRPHAGTLRRLVTPEGRGIRVDFGFESASEISPFYDSMLGKIIAHAENRDSAVAVMTRATQELIVEGLPTTVGFSTAVMRHPRFIAGNHWTTMIDEGVIEMSSVPKWSEQSDGDRTVIPVQGAPNQETQLFTIQSTSGPISLLLPVLHSVASAHVDAMGDALEVGSSVRPNHTMGPIAPMTGSLLRFTVSIGDHVTPETTIAFIESMKMETAIAAGVTGVVQELLVSPGDAVTRGLLLARIESIT